MTNVFEPEWQAEIVADGMVLRALRVGAQAGGQRLGATLYEMEPGASVSPLHLHHANEEMLLVLSGEATVRRPDSEWTAGPGELIAFPVGAPGAHQIVNRSDAPVRVLMISTMTTPDVAEHLDSGKILTITSEEDQPGLHAYRKSDEVPPFEGEMSGPPEVREPRQ
ncbi:MAG: hypothetical protein QOK25_3145 [Thermoleophilaceae bacterium]|jgi:uncharacterized cupin superfamily protein|nr:hypothetical protein [Thermoleophilaceae bacterium]